MYLLFGVGTSMHDADDITPLVSRDESYTTRILNMHEFSRSQLILTHVILGCV